MTSDHRHAGSLWLLCWLVYSLHWAPFLIREHLPAITLAEQGTLDVGRFANLSEDVFRTAGGGTYINNNPGASILAAVPLRLTRGLTEAIRRWNLGRPKPTVSPDLESALYRTAVEERTEWYYLAICLITTASVMAPLSSLTVAVMFLTLRAVGVSLRSSLMLALVYGFGTPVFFRTGYLNHNLLVGHAGFLGLWLVWDPADRPLAVGRSFAAGLLGGFALLADYTGALVILVLGAYVALRSMHGSWRPALPAMAAFAAGVAPGALGLVWYQAVAFGTPLLPSQHHMRAIAETAKGYRGIDWPSLDLAWMNFFDPRFGLFVYCPLLVLGIVAPLVRARAVAVPQRETWVLMGLLLVFAVFCAANQYSPLQRGTGVRYLVPVIPGLFLLAASVLPALPRILTAVLVGVTVAGNYLVALTHNNLPTLLGLRSPADVQASWLHRMHELGLIARPGAGTAVLVAVTLFMVWMFWRQTVREVRR